MLWEAWQRDYSSPAPTTVNTPSDIPSDFVTTDIPLDRPDISIPSASPPPLTYEPVATTDASTETVKIETDVLDLEISLVGAGISYAALKKYPVELKKPDEHFALFDQSPSRLFIHQGGMKGTTEAPTHRTPFRTDATAYTLGESDNELFVDFTWQSAENIEVIKRYTFARDSYVVEINYIVNNRSDAPWVGRVYEQLQRAKPESKRSLVYTFTGAALSTPEKRYKKYDYDDLEDAPLDIEVTSGWVGILEHYFVSAVIPPNDVPSKYYSLILDDNSRDDDRYAVGYWGPPIHADPGAQQNYKTSVYIGPKLQQVIREVAPGLDRTVDFGVLWFIAEPLFISLQFIKDITGNWGWAIIILTFLLKLMFFPLSAAGYRSMAKMRKVQPKMLAMKERYGKDRARMNQAMMELYKEEKINPLGGCLPILVQIPVFISLYWVLLESVELRQAPFALWLTDLTSKDPLYILPLIMGVSMWVQQKLNPAPMDPVQQKVMQILPFAFTIFFMFFPSGLVLYWVVNNILSIAQQWKITKNIEANA